VTFVGAGREVAGGLRQPHQDRADCDIRFARHLETGTSPIALTPARQIASRCSPPQSRCRRFQSRPAQFRYSATLKEFPEAPMQ